MHRINHEARFHHNRFTAKDTTGHSRNTARIRITIGGPWHLVTAAAILR